MKSGYTYDGHILLIEEKEIGHKIVKVMEPAESRDLIGCIKTALAEAAETKGGEDYPPKP